MIVHLKTLLVISHLWNWSEFCVEHLPLGKVGQAGENEDPHGQEEEEQAQLLVGISDCEAERLETRRVPGQLEDSQNPHDSEGLDDAPDFLEWLRWLVRLDQEQGDEVGKDGQQVDDVQGTLVGTGVCVRVNMAKSNLV